MRQTKAKILINRIRHIMMLLLPSYHRSCSYFSEDLNPSLYIIFILMRYSVTLDNKNGRDALLCSLLKKNDTASITLNCKSITCRLQISKKYIFNGQVECSFLMLLMFSGLTYMLLTQLSSLNRA
jgi:hypothetical protein